MRYQKSPSIALACLIAASSFVIAVARQPLSSALHFLARRAPQSEQLALLNDRTITLDDIDPRVREAAIRLESEVQTARDRVLKEQIDAFLFEAEAKRRRVTVARLFAIEVTRRVVDPTDEEIQAIYNANRAQFGSSDLTAARAQIVAYLRRESVAKLATDLAARLRKRFVVVMGVNVNSPNLTRTVTLATVAGRVISAGPILERLKPIVYDLRFRVYEAIESSVQRLINDLLVIDEATRRGIDPNTIIRQEITEKLRPPTEDDVVKFFEENKAHITGDLTAARASIVSYLAQLEQTKLENALNERLRKGANIRILLHEPESPVIAVSTDDDPSRGPVTAPAIVVVFTDFQCPGCAANHPIIDEVTKSYGSKVRLVVRDFPLDIHENARKAAEAANAAFAQGKFFEYIELLFKNQKTLDVSSLKKYATDIGLDRVRFDRELDSGAFEREVDHDVIDGVEYGIPGTPTVFVNGVRVNRLSAETLRAAIDRALAQKKAS